MADVGIAADIRRAYDEAMNALGKIDIVVNNAGTSRTAAFEEVTDEMWQQDLDEKLFAAIRLTRLAWPQMKERRWGRVINVLNIGAKAPRPKSAPTSVTRAAGMALTKVLAAEGAPHNVLVDALLVGLIEADQHVRGRKGQGSRWRTITRRAARRFHSAEWDGPRNRNIAYFRGFDAASYITGTAINVDGGRSPVV